jgi:uncharacterized iron-regulated membrane protein
MAAQTKIRLRGVWFTIHKWIGILLAILIIPVSLSGAALVWHDWLDKVVNPERQVSSGAARLPFQQYIDSARTQLGPQDRIASLSVPEEQGPVQVTAVRAPEGGGTRPVRTSVWLDPASGDVLDRQSGNEGVVRFLHVLHGSLMIPGMGRQIVGWIGVFMLVSSLTGLWLWWPSVGGFRRGLRWRRQDSTNANLHHTMGFWIALPLAMLSFTGVWISFPGVFGGNAPPAAAAKAKAAPRGPNLPLEQTRLDPEVAAVMAARGDAALKTLTWPTTQSPQWTVAVRDARTGPAEYKVHDQTGAVERQGPRPETTARTMRRWHDGDGMGPLWQTIIFIGGILPALLAVTGILMWLRTRTWRGGARKRRQEAGIGLKTK